MALQRRLLVTSVLLLLLLPVVVSAFELHLDNVLTESGEFFFTTKPIEDFSEVVQPPDAKRENVHTGATPHYLVLVDTDEVAQAKHGYFTYFIYVRPKAPGAPTSRLIVLGNTKAAFDDRLADVAFEITDGTQKESGTIRLPIYGSSPPAALVGPKWNDDDPIKAHIASETEIPLTVQNKLGDMEVNLNDLRTSSSTVWRKISGEWSAKSGEQLSGGETRSLRVKLEPRPAQAFFSALIRGKDPFDDHIQVAIEYATQGRRQTTDLNMSIPVHFVPWPPSLFPITLLGVLLGSLAPLASKESWRERGRAFLAAAIVALVVEALGMVLALNNSEFRIFGFRLDPFQMLPAMLIGVLIGMTGSRSLDRFRKILDADLWKGGKANA